MCFFFCQRCACSCEGGIWFVCCCAGAPAVLPSYAGCLFSTGCADVAFTVRRGCRDELYIIARCAGYWLQRLLTGTARFGVCACVCVRVPSAGGRGSCLRMNCVYMSSTNLCSAGFGILCSGHAAPCLGTIIMQSCLLSVKQYALCMILS